MASPATKPPRPLGVVVMGVLHILNGLHWLSGIVHVLSFEQFANLARSMGVSPQIAAAASLPTVVLMIAVGVGMLTGQRWSWWVAVIYHVLHVIDEGGLIYHLMTTTFPEATSPATIEWALIGSMAGFSTSLLALLYLYTAEVRACLFVEGTLLKVVTISAAASVVLAFAGLGLKSSLASRGIRLGP